MKGMSMKIRNEEGNDRYAEKLSEVEVQEDKKKQWREKRERENQKIALEMMHKSRGRELSKWRENKTVKGKENTRMKGK